MVRCIIRVIGDGTPYHFGEFLPFANRVGKLGPNVKKEGTMNLTRRNFLEGSALAGITAAVGLAGCSSGSQKEAPSEKQAESSPSTHNPVKTEDFDIVVVGSGTAGTCAALRASEKGASVLCLEKNSGLMGTSAFAEGFAGVN